MLDHFYSTLSLSKFSSQEVELAGEAIIESDAIYLHTTNVKTELKNLARHLRLTSLTVRQMTSR